MSKLKKCPFSDAASKRIVEALRRNSFFTYAWKKIDAGVGKGFFENLVADIIDIAWRDRRADHSGEGDGTVWISVEDRLPTAREDVLVVAYWHEAYQTLMGWYEPKSEVWHVTTSTGDKTDLNVTHWMPLPQPPKLEGGEG